MFTKEFPVPMGEQFRPKDWTYEMLTARLTQPLLAAQTEPAAFINARAGWLKRETDAKVSAIQGVPAQPEQKLSPAVLSELSDAIDVRDYIAAKFGLSLDITDQSAYVIWGKESRRQYNIGPLNAAGLLTRYAKTVDVVADQETKEELKQSGLLKED